MKKLLLLLLLFFPVHGAWAEIINLECQNKDGSSSTPVILDTSKKTVINLAGNKLNLKITELSYEWVSTLPSPIGGFKAMSVTNLNRTNGLATTYVWMSVTKQEYILSKPWSAELFNMHALPTSDHTDYRQCEKTSGKKKF